MASFMRDFPVVSVVYAEDYSKNSSEFSVLSFEKKAKIVFGSCFPAGGTIASTPRCLGKNKGKAMSEKSGNL
jgi:hypothetical protein